MAFGPDSPLKKRLADTEQITLTHDQNEVAFDFLALHFANPAMTARTIAMVHTAMYDAWAGRDTSGQNLNAGVYFVRLRAGDVTKSRKVLLLR